MNGDESKPRFAHSQLIWFGVGFLFLAALNLLALYLMEISNAKRDVLGLPLATVAVCGAVYLVSIGVGFIAAGIDKVVKQRRAKRDIAAQR